jgi:hypothetical protein
MKRRKDSRTAKSSTIYEQIFDGDWEPCYATDNREMCCDCGLVHIVDYRVICTKDKHGIKHHAIQQRVRRDSSRTYNARRRMGIKIIRMKRDSENDAVVRG